MSKQLDNFCLLGLAIQSYLAIGLFAVLPLIAMLNDHKLDLLTNISFAFLGSVGITAFRVLSQQSKRIEDLERQLDK